jgi:N-acetylglucosamine malate deacetylase 1
MAKVLVVAPHAMDEVLGCGGALARHADGGDDVHTLVLFGNGSGMDAKRRESGPRAAAILGTAAPRFSGFPENRSDTIPLLDVVAAVDRAIGELRPQILYVPHGGSLNIDHQTTFRAALTAARPVPAYPVREIYGYEIASSTEWSSSTVSIPFLPGRFVDITGTFDRKMKALECYRAELRSSPHSRSVEGVTAHAASRGHSVGFAYAEAFSVVRQLIGDKG